MTPEERDALKKGDTIYDMDGKPREVISIPLGVGAFPEYPLWRIEGRFGYVEVGPVNMLVLYGTSPRGGIEQYIANCETRAQRFREDMLCQERYAAEARERLAAL